MLGRRAFVGLVTVLLICGLWFVTTTATGWISGGRFPSPAECWASLTQIITRGYAGAPLWSHALQSVWLVVMGFAVAIATGAPLGLGWVGAGGRKLHLSLPRSERSTPWPPRS